jgi:HEAT repeat protein
LDVWAAGAVPADEATAIDAVRMDVDALVSAVLPRAPAADRAKLWIDRRRDLQQILSEAMSRGGVWRRRALESLDSRNDGPGLWPLAPEGDAPQPAAVASAVRELAAALRDRLAGLLDDADPTNQALAVRVLVKVGDARVTPARIAAAAGGKAPALRDAAAFCARWQARANPAAAPALAAALGAALAEASSWEPRLALVTALGAVGPAATSPLERALEDDSPMVRAAAAAALASVEAATPALVAAADDSVAAVRAAAARALSGRRNPAARGALERLGRDESARVRQAAGAAPASEAAQPRP